MVPNVAKSTYPPPLASPAQLQMARVAFCVEAIKFLGAAALISPVSNVPKLATLWPTRAWLWLRVEETAPALIVYCGCIMIDGVQLVQLGSYPQSRRSNLFLHRLIVWQIDASYPQKFPRLALVAHLFASYSRAVVDLAH